MDRPRLEVADIFRRYGAAYRQHQGAALTPAQRHVMTAIELCRTAALGGHLERCDSCAYERPCYDSCRNRHCPKCQSLARAQWVAKRQAEILPTHYFHVVFTLPEQIAAIAYQNKELVYGMLFRATAATLSTIAADPKHLGAEIGFFAVLHTWGQNLLRHPHLHCIIPGGGISADDSRWISCRRHFLFPVKVLSRLFRAKFVSLLKRAFHQAKLRFHGKLQPLAKTRNFFRWLNDSIRSEWVVYAKPPFGGPQQVLKYLARDTHRVAISNRRLVALHNGSVTFRWKDYAQRNQSALMTLDATEFIRRFLLHVLPKGLVRIRHFGFLANRCRRQKILLCRRLLDVALPVKSHGPTPADHAPAAELKIRPIIPCPLCKVGCLRPIERLLPQAPVLASHVGRLVLALPETNTS
jgi:hypothetical protein